MRYDKRLLLFVPHSLSLSLSSSDRAQTEPSRYLFIPLHVFHGPHRIISGDETMPPEWIGEEFFFIRVVLCSNRPMQTKKRKNKEKCHKLWYDAEVNATRRRTAAKNATNLNDSFARNGEAAQNESTGGRNDDSENATKLIKKKWREENM